MSEFDFAAVKGRWSNYRIGTGRGEDVAPEADAGEAAEAFAPPAIEAVEPISGTFIGADALFEGTLRLQGDFFIDSEFKGALDTDGKLVVGPSAAIEGDIRAREVVVCGAVVGNITARRQLVLRSNARLHGDIETACLEIEKYAFFRGNTAMTRPQDEVRERVARRPEPTASPQAPPPSV